jgi:hypothetical protein
MVNNNHKQHIEENNYSFYISFQNNIKLILTVIIILNFVIIFLLKLSIRKKEKYSRFIKIEEENTTDKTDLKQVIKDILFIIAHPDDEIMFFFPTIKTLLNAGHNVRIICLSNGNADKIGKVREIELEKVCSHLKIKNYEIIDNENLQDCIKTKWDQEIVADVIKEYLDKDNNIDSIGTIVTFDERGVTKHPNHISCHDGLM